MLLFCNQPVINPVNRKVLVARGERISERGRDAMACHGTLAHAWIKADAMEATWVAALADALARREAAVERLRGLPKDHQGRPKAIRVSQKAYEEYAAVQAAYRLWKIAYKEYA